MCHYKGRVTAVYHHSGCWEVVVEGECSGSFPIDNIFIWPMVATYGADWIGREVEYEDGEVLFLDTSPTTPAVQTTSAQCPPALP